ncbi:MAG: hypothetical protein HY698_08930 [Deltaproteobacteria bacterium]|nr:hypothetical protein [Deltaproteobacteria bacterium]
MSARLLPCLALLALLLLYPACPRPRIQRSYPDPRPEQVLAHLQSLEQRVSSLRAETLSDVRLGKERANLTVLILAAWGGKLRFMAMNPNQSMAADLASDGAQYCFLDANHNCGECGPATSQSVARLIRITLDPEQVVPLLLGSTPILTNASAKVTWDPDEGHEIVELAAGPFTQRIVLDGKNQRWDVLESVLREHGKLAWRLRHKDFHEVRAPDGQVDRLPGKSLFEEPRDSVLIRWKEQEVNVPLDESKFRIDIPAGISPCRK